MDGAIRSYRAALNDPGDSAEGHVALGTITLIAVCCEMPWNQFRRATTLSPKWADASLLLGLTYDMQGKRDDAGRAFATAARARPDSAAIGYARVQHAVKRGCEEEICALLDFKDRHDRVVRPSTPRAQATPFVRLGSCTRVPAWRLCLRPLSTPRDFVC